MKVFGSLLACACLAASASAQSTPAPAASPADSKSIKIKWSTASEVDNYGFYMMRGETGDGPFKQLNDKPVPGANNSDVPSKYQFEDEDVTDGKTYFYYIESISTQGVREKFSPVLSKVCCGRPEPPKLVEQEHAAPAAVATPEPEPTPSPAKP